MKNHNQFDIEWRWKYAASVAKGIRGGRNFAGKIQRWNESLHGHEEMEKFIGSEGMKMA